MKKFAINRCLISLVFFGTILCNEHLLVDKLRLDFIKLEEEIWKYVLWETPNLDYFESESYLVKKFSEFDEELKQMPEEILRGLEPIKHIHSFILLYPELRQTENLYETFRQYLKDQKNISRATIETAIESDHIVKDILNSRIGANATVHKVYNLTFGDENMLLKILQFFEDDFYCKNFFQSPQQVYYNLYNAIALNGLKSYIMMQFAYLAKQIELKTDQKGNYSDLTIILRTSFQRRVNQTMTVFRGAMELVPKTIWRCDPKLHIKGETYDQFTRLIQAHIENEVDMNPTGTCTANCGAYNMAKSYGCFDSDSKYCKEMERCSGKIVGCRFIESHMNICLSKTHARRYDYIQYESGKHYGKKMNCWKKPVNSWYRWFVHCSYCLCLCDEQGSKSDRYISLRPVLSDVKNNRVVTGLRLIKNNKIIHLQIQEGQLLPYGYINESTMQWVPVDDFKITDEGIYNGEDYFMMNYEYRSMALDDVKIDQNNYVVTGVRFQLINNKIRFQIHVNAVDWSKGLVIKSNSNYIYKATGGRNKVAIDPNADVPTLLSNSELEYDNNLYVEFTHTGFVSDAAQTTIPFFDTQPIFSKPAVPLIGAGIQYKGTKGSGGFIVPTISTYDYSNFLLTEFPKIGLRSKSDLPQDDIEIN